MKIHKFNFPFVGCVIIFIYWNSPHYVRSDFYQHDSFSLSFNSFKEIFDSLYSSVWLLLFPLVINILPFFITRIHSTHVFCPHSNLKIQAKANFTFSNALRLIKRYNHTSDHATVSPHYLFLGSTKNGIFV